VGGGAVATGSPTTSSATGSGGAGGGTSATTGSAGGVGGAAGSGGAAGGSAGASGAGGGPTGGPGSIIDPQCWDGKAYLAEPVPASRANIADLIASFNLANKLPWSIQVLSRRYPNGAAILTGATQPPNAPNGEANCYGIAYGSMDTTAQKIIAGFRTSVHECGHMMDLNHDRFMMRADLEYKCSISLGDGTPPRSIILGDEFDALGPKGGNLDFQKDVYLKPTGTGNGGDQNFPLLFTEFSQYVNTLATSYGVYDVAPDDSIAGDASRDFAWFTERYLRLLRASYKSEYDKIAGDACWRQLILAVWGRVNRYWYESTRDKDVKLVSTEAAKVDVLISDPRLLAEIENLRVLDGCR
jgi:hypothetical protein